MMHPAARYRWADALTRGNFTQCEGIEKAILPDGSAHHCAIGVLGEIASKDLGNVFTDMTITAKGYDTCMMIADMDRLAEWAGFEDVEEFRAYLERFSTMNDAGCSFAHIAASMEEVAFA
jgi:hypothetical protein